MARRTSTSTPIASTESTVDQVAETFATVTPDVPVSPELIEAVAEELGSTDQPTDPADDLTPEANAPRAGSLFDGGGEGDDERGGPDDGVFGAYLGD